MNPPTPLHPVLFGTSLRNEITNDEIKNALSGASLNANKAMLEYPVRENVHSSIPLGENNLVWPVEKNSGFKRRDR